MACQFGQAAFLILTKCCFSDELLQIIWKFLKITERKMPFLDIIFQQDNASVHKLNIIGNFFRMKI